MKWSCPHCNHAAWAFKRDKTAPGKHRTYVCPSCTGLVRKDFNWKLFALLFPAAAIAAIVVGMELRAAGLGDYSGIFTGLMVVSACLPAMRLKRVESE